jgi:hypothetical protein
LIERQGGLEILDRALTAQQLLEDSNAGGMGQDAEEFALEDLKAS